MRKTRILYLLLIFFLWGCATWVAVGGKYTMSSQNFEVQLPTGWRKYEVVKDALLITQDGLALQQIRISRMQIDKELNHTKKKFSKEMLPPEVAEVVIDNFRSNPNIINQKIIENDPAQIGGYSGYKFVFSYQTKKGLTKKGINYGFISGNWFYEIIYEAAERYYFEKDISAIENVKDSFRLIKKTAS
jgi:hypothetical protein